MKIGAWLGMKIGAWLGRINCIQSNRFFTNKVIRLVLFANTMAGNMAWTVNY